MANQERYPWGLRLNLETEAIKKLAIKTKNLTVGGKVTVVAEAEIASISERQAMSGEDQRSMELQITKMKFV